MTATLTQANAQSLSLPPIPHATTNEKLIVGKLVMDLLTAGCQITVNDGEEDVVRACTDATLIWPALSSTDMDYLFVCRPGETRNRSVTLVWGNDLNVISDYSIALEALVAPANALSETLS